MSQLHYPHYEPPKSRFKALRRDVVACLVIVTLLAVIIVPVFQQARDYARQASCSSQLRGRTSFLLQYATDNDDYLSPASQWQTASSSDMKEEKSPCPALSYPAPGMLGYAMDSRLSGRSLERIGAPHEQRILLYESSNLTQNAHDTGTSFIVRHGYGTISFVDGHAKMYKQEPGERVVRKGIFSP